MKSALKRTDRAVGMRQHEYTQPDKTTKAHQSRCRFQSDPDLTNTELVQLRMRVIALENLMIAVLPNAEHQLNLAQHMAEYILPRDGATEHPLTIHAATQMSHLVERARLFQRGAVDEADAFFRPVK